MEGSIVVCQVHLIYDIVRTYISLSLCLDVLSNGYNLYRPTLSLSLSIYLDDLSEGAIPVISMLQSISPFRSSSLFFMYLGAPELGA